MLLLIVEFKCKDVKNANTSAMLFKINSSFKQCMYLKENLDACFYPKITDK